MEKLDFTIAKKEITSFLFQANKIEILPYIPQEVKYNVAKNYINFMLSDEDNLVQAYYSAEWSIIMGILEGCTNIKATPENFDSIIDSGLWEEVKSRLVNYNEFMQDLQAIYANVADKITLEKSLGNTFDKLANKVAEFFDKISEIDLSKESIGKLVEALRVQTTEFEEKFPTAVAKPTRKKRESKKTDS